MIKSVKRETDEARLDSTVRLASITGELLFQSKWRIHILFALRKGPVRLGQLSRMIPDASKKVLTQNLRDLEAGGVVLRTDLSDVVLHIEYRLNPNLEEGVGVLLDQMLQWGGEYLLALKQ